MIENGKFNTFFIETVKTAQEYYNIMILKFLRKLKKKLAIDFTRPINEEILASLLEIVSLNIYKQKREKGENVIFMFPSELSKCLRLAYFKYQQENDTFGISPAFRAGNIIDAGIEKLITDFQKQKGVIYLLPKFPVKYTLNIDKNRRIVISGSVDFVSKNAIVEIKSSARLQSKIYPSDTLQAGFYAKALSLEFDQQFDAYLIYIYRNLFLYRIYKLSQEEIDEGFNTLIENAKKLYQHLERKTIPDPKPDFWCKGCPVLALCKEGQEFLEKVAKEDVTKVLETIKQDYENFNKILEISKKYNLI